jgi:hypothetical protein
VGEGNKGRGEESTAMCRYAREERKMMIRTLIDGQERKKLTSSYN